MKYALSHDGASKIKVELADGKFTTFPYMKGLNLRFMIYSFLFQHADMRLDEIKPVELSEIPEFPSKLILGEPAEKLDLQKLNLKDYGL